ncbi:malto-oligosyltrehalose synthase [Streptomyces sp. FIT100]|uniref:malto-oligosyltrehalose synthase n=1 Tax=Streptomyces sp. FIT100 TaxID=2837956 RepID=UPI0021C599B7|nr:malto-oligosyltrehalose synthase [Streptomyces sp. FIT100]UUN29884.1 malto-oligosyltrehalose synthase [Streptomyces sp. FIT100]
MTPTATYRLQLQPAFPFAAAEEAVPYLAGLGISHLHLSPVLEAVPGSGHGYDVTEHARVREELGGEEGLRALARTAREHGLGLVLDIVPNHMAAVPRCNHALWEVLREGPQSPYAHWFDIDWDAGGGRVLMPVLGGRLGEELDELSVQGRLLHYGEHTFPLREGTEGLPLPELLEAQWYRLAWWRLARTELNYRRFFTISELIGVRVEDPEVFDATHTKILELVRDGVVDGLRIDHPDGLADPEGYLRRLHEATGGCWTVVEKILTRDEHLPREWPVAGTTGYDALHRIDGLFTDPVGAEELLRSYQDFASPGGDRGGWWGATVRRAAYKVVTHELVAETEALARIAERVCAADPMLHDHAPWALRTAIRELLVRVPVYRPYRTGGEAVLTADAALRAKAAFAVPEEAAAVDVIRDLALGLGRSGEGPDRTAFRARFAQTSSALRAKSVEDTAFYRYAPLLSANEVGGDPGFPAVSPAEFHAYCARVSRDWPASGTVLSTHDTKRSADVRARISVLSQCPERWERVLTGLAWVPAPDHHLAWVAWQAAFGLGSPRPDRLGPALLKSVREAGLHTSWTEPDPDYERAVCDFVDAGPAGPPMHTLALFVGELDEHVRANALGAALVQLTMPGVPELYQGTEREYLALVDPDNRQPFRQGPPDEKTALTRAALLLRRRRPEVFGEPGTYAPLEASGPAAEHCLAFRRSGEVVTAVTRLSLRLEEAGGWADTSLALPEGWWTDLLDPTREFEGGGPVPVPLTALFADRPVALLERKPEDGPEGRAANAGR